MTFFCLWHAVCPSLCCNMSCFYGSATNFGIRSVGFGVRGSRFQSPGSAFCTSLSLPNVSVPSCTMRTTIQPATGGKLNNTVKKLAWKLAQCLLAFVSQSRVPSMLPFVPSLRSAHPLEAEIRSSLIPGCQKALARGRGSLSPISFLLGMNWPSQQVPAVLPYACLSFVHYVREWPRERPSQL